MQFTITSIATVAALCRVVSFTSKRIEQADRDILSQIKRRLDVTLPYIDIMNLDRFNPIKHERSLTMHANSTTNGSFTAGSCSQDMLLQTFIDKLHSLTNVALSIHAVTPAVDASDIKHDCDAAVPSDPSTA